MATIQVCRICLGHDTRMYTVTHPSLLKFYEKITNIPFNKERGKTSMVCYICHALLKKCHRFTESAIKADEMLQQLRRNRIQMTEKNISKLNKSMSLVVIKKGPTINVNVAREVCVPEVKTEVEDESLDASNNGIEKRTSTVDTNIPEDYDIYTVHFEPRKDGVYLRSERIGNELCQETDTPESVHGLDNEADVPLRTCSSEDKGTTDNVAESLRESNDIHTEFQEHNVILPFQFETSNNVDDVTEDIDVKRDTDNIDNESEIEDRYSDIQQPQNCDSEAELPQPGLESEGENEEVECGQDNNEEERNGNSGLHDVSIEFIGVNEETNLEDGDEQSKPLSSIDETEIDQPNVFNFEELHTSEPGINNTMHFEDMKAESAENLEISEPVVNTLHFDNQTETVNTNDVFKGLNKTKNSQMFICNQCGETFKRKNVLIEHLSLHIQKSSNDSGKEVTNINSFATLKKKTSKKFICDHCKIEFSHKRVLAVHMLKHNRFKEFTGESDKDLKSVQLLKHYNELPFDKSLKELKEKGITHLGALKKKFCCEICGKGHANESQLISHLRIHMNRKLFVCNECGRKYAYKCNLVRHLQTHSKSKYEINCNDETHLKEDSKMSSNICKRDFVNGNALKQHHTHSETKSFVCDHCGACFNKRNKLIWHMPKHSTYKPFTCPECGSKFGLKGSLNKHLKTHTIKKQLYCTVCKMVLTDYVRLRLHMKEHISGSPYNCNECEKSFKQRSGLVKHLRRHFDKRQLGEKSIGKIPSNEKALVCDICKKIFKNGNRLSIHLRIHNKEKPFTCSECEKGFTRKSDLTKHLRTHSGVEPTHLNAEGTELTYSDAESVHSGAEHSHSSLEPTHSVAELTNSRAETTHSVKENSHSGVEPIHMVAEPTHSVAEPTHWETESADLSLELTNTSPEVSDSGAKLTQSSTKLTNFSTKLNRPSSKPTRSSAKTTLLNSEPTDLITKHTNASTKPTHSRPKVSDSGAKLTRSDENFCICDKCGVHFKNNSVLKMHYIRFHTGEKPFSCNECGKSCASKGDLSKHVVIHMDFKPYACNICGKKFLVKTQLKIHLRVHTKEKPYACKVCNKKLSHKGSIKLHMRTHSGEKPFACSICGNKYRYRPSLKEHMRKHENESGSRFPCHVCGKAFETKYRVQRHLLVHNSDKQFPCDVCGKSFAYASSLKTHSMLHSGERPFECDFCGHKFTTMGRMVKHVRTHTKEKPFACTICESRFASNETLKKHLRVHTGDKPFGCKYCDMKFANPSNLQLHVRIHTGEKPYKCQYCDKAFANKSNFNLHVQTHTGKRYGCNYCGKEFKQKISLSKHVKVHLVEKVACDICGHTFGNKKELRKHSKDSHKLKVRLVKSRFF